MRMFVAAVILCLAGLYGASTVPCICTLEYAPVCGDDGKTYGNKCEMNCAGVTLAYIGACTPIVVHADPQSTTPTLPCACPKIYRPVCGQDGKTYGNQCELNCAGVALFQDGPCSASSTNGIQKRATTPCICTFIYMPVCGSDGVTYGNDCNRECASKDAVAAGKAAITAINGPCPTTTRSTTTTTMKP